MSEKSANGTWNSWLRSLAADALGLFIVWQIVFLISSNFLGMLEETRTENAHDVGKMLDHYLPKWRAGEGRLYVALNEAEKITSTWGEITAQSQGWSLFSPNITNHVPFLELELRWDTTKPTNHLAWCLTLGNDNPLALSLTTANLLTQPPIMPRSPERLLSENEPEDIHAFQRFGKFRLRRYEGQLGVTLVSYSDETEAETAKRWRELIRKELRRDWDATLAYMKWRTNRYLEKHPDCPMPTEVTLNVRRYKITAPDDDESWNWRGPFTEPFARWLPQTTVPDTAFPVQMFDHMQNKFVWLE